jgi:DeoR/GlpR family transcriptional regulator of sugar metabolism
MSIRGAIIETFSNFFISEGNMSIYERQQRIMHYIRDKKFATVKELSALVYSSEASIRRDIKSLAYNGLVVQLYGGVTLPEFQNGVVPISLRDTSNSALKESIAKRAAEEIFGGATVFMDGSSTVRRVIKHIKTASPITIVTNNANIFSEKIPSGVTVYCTGGLLKPESKIYVGSGAHNFLSGINADLLFFSSQAISNDGEISDASEEETALRKIMLARAKRKIFLCDSSKLGKERTFAVCGKDDVDLIICDKRLPWE